MASSLSSSSPRTNGSFQSLSSSNLSQPNAIINQQLPVAQSKRVGRAGKQNWNGNDLDAMLQLMSNNPPYCSTNWANICQQYNDQYAKVKGRSVRTERSMIEKFESLCKGPSTGQGGPSDRQTLARNIQERILSVQGARLVVDSPILSDDDFNFDEIHNIEKSSIEETPIEIQSRIEEITDKRRETAGTFARKRLLEGMSEASNDSAGEFLERRLKRQRGNDTLSAVLLLIQEQREERKLERQRYEEDKKFERERLELQRQELINQQQRWELILMKMLEKEK
jgi:hypothetical protein